MDLISQVTKLGGAYEREVLHKLREEAEVKAAVDDGTLLPVGRTRLVLATSPDDIRAASSVSGVLSHRSAARRHGWAQFRVPDRPEVSIPRSRRLRGADPGAIIPHWIDLEPHEIDGMWTTKERTLRDVMRNLSPSDSLPIVNSAIRADDFTVADVRSIADACEGRGRTRIRHIARAATGKPANVFESALQALGLHVNGLELEPQFAVRVPHSKLTLHPDFADKRRKIALEAEGFEWHGDRKQLTRDCQRYNSLALLGWLVIRFSWDLVRFEPEYVLDMLVAAVAERPLLAGFAA